MGIVSWCRRQTPDVRWAFVDWGTLLGVMLVVGFINLFPPFERQVLQSSLDGLKYEFKTETVGMGALIAISVFVPLAVFIVCNFLFFKPHTRRRDLYQSLLGLCVSIAFTLLFTEFLKIFAGRPRPDFFFRCFPDGVAHWKNEFELNCTGNTKTIQEGYKSWPSGHSSMSASGLVFCALWCAGKLHLCDGRYHSWKMFLCVLPVLLALWVAISRTEDNRHFWRDALTGFLLGSLIASVSYFAHYESLWSHISHLPKKLRSDVESDSVSQSRTQSQSGGEPTAQSETQSLISDASNAHEILEMDNVK